MNKLILALTSILLAGCIPPATRVDSPRTEALDKAYTVDLPSGWIREYTSERNLVASRDGFLLESIAVVRHPLKDAFPRTKKAATDALLPSELAELEIAEIMARDELTAALTVLENDPAPLSGKEGFRLKVSYNNPRGLEFIEVVHGAVDGTALYLVTYRAPRLYYFERYYPEFQKTVASFTLNEAKKLGRLAPADERRRLASLARVGQAQAPRVEPMRRSPPSAGLHGAADAAGSS